jgi:TorA maturation chaperone TorD
MTGASQVAASPDCEASAGTAAETLSGTAAETARERSGLYGFLAEVFRAEPTADLLHKIREPDFLDHLSAAGADPGADFPHRDEDDLIEDLAVEYARLFLGPGPHVHPYAAVYLAGEGASLWGPATAQFIAYSERAGLELASKHRSLPDHVSIEFEFMAKMAAREARAVVRSDPDLAAKCRRIQKTFLDEHLGCWLPRFCARTIEQAKLPFYTAMAKLALGFVESELRCFAEPGRIH